MSLRNDFDDSSQMLTDHAQHHNDLADAVNSLAGLYLIEDINLAADNGGPFNIVVPQTYRHLLLLTDFRTNDTDAVDEINLTCNSDTPGAGPNQHTWYVDQALTHTGFAGAQGSGVFGDAGGVIQTVPRQTPLTSTIISTGAADAAPVGSFGGGSVWIPNYTNPNSWKKFLHNSSVVIGDGSGENDFVVKHGSSWRLHAEAISQINLYVRTGSLFRAGSRFTLYGL